MGETRVELTGGLGRSAPAKVELLGHGVNTSWLSVEIEEGKNRQVRRMLLAIGSQAIRLKRGRLAELITVIRLVIGWVSECSEQPRGYQHDDQQRDAIEDEGADVAVGPQAQAGVGDHVEGDRGEEAAEDQAEDQQGVPEIGIHMAQ